MVSVLTVHGKQFDRSLQLFGKCNSLFLSVLAFGLTEVIFPVFAHWDGVGVGCPLLSKHAFLIVVPLLLFISV